MNTPKIAVVWKESTAGQRFLSIAQGAREILLTEEQALSLAKVINLKLEKAA